MGVKIWVCIQDADRIETETEIDAALEMTVEALTRELIESHGLGNYEDESGKPIEWRLLSSSDGWLNPQKSLLDANVYDGMRLSLVLNRKVTVGPGIHEITQVLTLLASSGVAAGAYNLLKAWIAAKNGRKLRLKVGAVEVEATQMPEADVLRLLELLQKNAEEKKIRDLLLQTPQKPPTR
jgi:hypothetical protein